MKKMINIVLSKLDRFIVKLSKWNHIPYSNNNFMYLNPHEYHGRAIILRDGTTISTGDLVGELHIDNTKIRQLDTGYASLLRLLRGEMKGLKKAFDEEPYSKLKAVYGISVFYEIAFRQGFTVIEINSRLKRFFGSLWENLLRLVIKKGKKTRKMFVYSKECWLSKNQIIGIK